MCVSETPLGASDPSSFDTGVKSEPESVPGLGLGPDSELLTVKNNDSEDGHITVDTENSATAEQFQDEDDSGDSDGSSASDLQVLFTWINTNSNRWLGSGLGDAIYVENSCLVIE